MNADVKADPPRRFVVLAAPRTGSNWLCSMLGSHPEVLCHHELFNPAGIHVALALRDGAFDVEAALGTAAARDRTPLAFLARAWDLTLGHHAVGFKLNRGQNEEAFAAVLADTGVSKLVLHRANRLKTFVSEQIAQLTGHWESYPSSPRADGQVRITVDLDELRRHVDQNRAYYDFLAEALAGEGQRVLEVRYEELLASAGAWTPVFGLLGVAPASLRAETRKQNATDLRQVVANFGELEAALAGTELEAELRSLTF